MGSLASEVESVGDYAGAIAKQKENKLLQDAKREKIKRKVNKIRAIQEEERKKRSEGTTYGAGCAPLPT